MANLLVTGQTRWKVGELGYADFYLKESDGTTARVLTGHVYKLYAWTKDRNTKVIDGATLTNQTASTGQLRYTVVTADTASDRVLYAEIVEDSTGNAYRTDTFTIIIDKSHP